MFGLFKPKNKAILGLDISSFSVKLLQVSGNQENLRVDGYYREHLPANALDGRVIKDINAVAKCIRNVHERSKLTCKQVALAVPDSSVITKTVQINKGLSDMEMEEFVILEADKYIPYPIDEVNLDFEVQGSSLKNPDTLDVLVVASRAENVSSRVDAVTRAGLEAVVVDVESYSVERAAQLFVSELPNAGQNKIVAIVDIGMHISSLFVLNGMKLIFSREEHFGGNQLINAITEQYGYSFEQAVMARETNNLPKEYEAISSAFQERVLLEVKRTLQFFYSASQHGVVDYILLGGLSANELGLVDKIQQELQIKTSLVNPLSYLPLGDNVPKDLITRDAPSLLVACGLALRNIEYKL